MKIEIDPSGHVRRTIIEHKGDLHPQIIIEDAEGKILDYKYIPERASIEVNDGQMISAGTLLAKTPREVGGTQDITGGLPRVTELFEARRPKEPAVIAEIDGRVELLEEKRRGKRTIIVRNESGIEREHLVPARQVPPRPRRRPRPAGDAAGRRPAGAARHPADLRRGGRAALPAPRDPERLPLASASRSTTSTSRSSSPRCCARCGSRASATPASCPARSSTSSSSARVNHGTDELREDQGPRRHRVPRRRHRPATTSSRRTSASRRPASARPSGSGPSRRRPAPSSWASPRRPCSPTASSRPPASRRRPRC